MLDQEIGCAVVTRFTFLSPWGISLVLGWQGSCLKGDFVVRNGRTPPGHRSIKLFLVPQDSHSNSARLHGNVISVKSYSGIPQNPHPKSYLLEQF